MPRFPVSPYWSSNPNIPIYLDRSEECEDESREPSHSSHPSEPTHPRHAPEYICPTCETSSRDTPIHCVSVASSPAPPAYSSISPHPPPSPRHLTVPTLKVETPRHWSKKPETPRPSLQFDTEGRPNVRFRRNAFSPLSPTVTEFDEVDWSRKSMVGLGISDAPIRSDTSPITPGTIEKQGGDEDAAEFSRPTNFAQRVEQKLWNYTASRSVVKRWLLEIISWSISAACMAGIIIMLLKYQNDRIPTWPLGMTLNAYISVLSKIASAALLLPVSEALGQLKWSWFQGDNSKKMWDFEIFDNASRGPWGSLLLLVRTKGRSLAALGACVTIMALALDPFFQQVVEYPEHWRLQIGNGSIPRAISYQPFSLGKEWWAGYEYLEPDQIMLGITNKFFYGNGTNLMKFGQGVRSDVPLGCPNSNCTWPEYETLGVTNECVDATDRLIFRCENTTMDWTQQVIESDKQEDPVIYPNGTSCGWWLDAEPGLLMTGYNAEENTERFGEVLMMRAQPLYDVLTRRFLPGYESKLNNSRNPLAHVVIVSGVEYDRVLQNATPIAHECMISWSAKSILSTYTQGGYEEKVTNTILNGSVAGNPWTTLDLFDDDGLWIGTDYTYHEDVIIQGKTSTYKIDNRTQALAIANFDDIFPSTYSVLNHTKTMEGMLRYKQYFYLTRSYRSRNLTYNPFLYDNITTHLDRMANAMTNAMRSASSDTEPVLGQAFDLENFVDVRWPWMTLPLTLLGLTGLFLLATIFVSSKEKDHVGVWKTSAIATLLYGLPDDMSKKMTASKAQGTPRMKAKEVKVKWIPSRGWRFSGVSISPSSIKNNTSPISTKSNASTALHKARQSPPI